MFKKFIMNVIFMTIVFSAFSILAVEREATMSYNCPFSDLIEEIHEIDENHESDEFGVNDEKEKLQKEKNEKKYVEFLSKKVLQKSFQDAAFDHFIEKTHILDIVDQKLVLLDVANRVEMALYDYINDLDPVAAVIVKMNHSRIYEILLQVDPAAREELKNAGIYESDVKHDLHAKVNG